MYYFLIGSRLGAVVNYIIALPIVLHLALSSAHIYAFTLCNRFLGKEIFQRFYFKEEMYMPTTNFLMSTNTTLSVNMKQKIRQKLQSDFNIALAGPAAEQQDPDDSRKQIVFAVSQIKNRTRGNALLLQHNYEYGFIRNFLGGSVFALFNCLVNEVVFLFIMPHQFAFALSISLGVFYMLFLLLSKWLIVRHGKGYAKVLFEQYLHS